MLSLLVLFHLLKILHPNVASGPHSKISEDDSHFLPARNLLQTTHNPVRYLQSFDKHHYNTNHDVQKSPDALYEEFHHNPHIPPINLFLGDMLYEDSRDLPLLPLSKILYPRDLPILQIIHKNEGDDKMGH